MEFPAYERGFFVKQVRQTKEDLKMEREIKKKEIERTRESKREGEEEEVSECEK